MGDRTFLNRHVPTNADPSKALHHICMIIGIYRFRSSLIGGDQITILYPNNKFKENRAASFNNGAKPVKIQIMKVLETEINSLRQAMYSELTRGILPFHINNMCDPRGGFYGTIANDQKVDYDAPKGLVQCARLLWTYARAYRVFPEAAYLKMAAAAYDELMGRFHDHIHQGFYWTLTTEGRPLDRTKMVYGQAFAIYGLAEYHLATSSHTVRKQAIDLFYLLEEHARDNKYGGYWEACTDSWQPDLGLSVDQLEIPPAKSMNTHLHVMEAYSNLLLAWDDDFLKERLHALVDIHLQHIFDSASGHLRLHFDRQWQPMSDHISYGHDIEASWLLWESAEILGDADLCSSTRATVLRLAEVTLAEAVGSDGGLVEAGDPSGISNHEKHWWPQAEAMVGFLNAYQMTGSQRYLEAVFYVWNFIREQIIDREHGEWIWGIDDNGAPLSREMAGLWKTPYHNGRACLEIMHRLDKLEWKNQ